MAAFASLDACDARIKAKTSGFGDGTWIEGYSQKTITGVLAIRVIRKMPPLTNGGWVDITDDATV